MNTFLLEELRTVSYWTGFVSLNQVEVGQLASRRVWEAACQAHEKYFSFKKMNVQIYSVLHVILSCYDEIYTRRHMWQM